MHGLGNDFILINGFGQKLPEDPGAFAEQICRRRTGVGADGLIWLAPPSSPSSADAEFIIYNDDGSRAEMCGNGIRAAALFARREGIIEGSGFRAETLAGIIDCGILEYRAEDPVSGMVRVDMGRPRLNPADIPVSVPGGRAFGVPVDIGAETYRLNCVSMGNPHAVIFADSLEDIDLAELGPLISKHPLFPRQTNVEIARVISGDKIEIRVFERGVGITPACGTGAAAAMYAAYLLNLTAEKCEVLMPGGSLFFEYGEDKGMMMKGPARAVFFGDI